MDSSLRAVMVVVMAFVLGGSTLLLSANQSKLVPPQPPGEQEVPADYGIDLDRSIRLFESRVAEREHDYLSRIALGRLYLQKAKRVEDGTYYDLAEVQFADALTIHDNDSDAMLGLAAVGMANHLFREALTLAEDVWAAHPDQLLALAVQGDALVELGRYDAASEIYSALVEQVATAPVQARRARLAELQGDPEEAARLLDDAWRQALESGATGRDESWYVQRMGELALAQGRLDEARRDFRKAHELDPESRPPLQFLGHTEARAGNLDEAEAYYWQALQRVVDPGVYAALGDLRVKRGKTDEANAYFDRAVQLWGHGSDHHHHHHELTPLPGEPAEMTNGEQKHTHSHANAEAFDRTLASFLADHERDPSRALMLARRNVESRQDVYSEDALAWALYRNGQFDEAHEASQRALSQGTHDASFLFHAGLIHEARGDRKQAIQCLQRALAINPHFSVLHVTTAEESLDELL